jgi:hypothetical protein
VLFTTSSKWVYMLNSVEKWLCEGQKKKTVVDGAISIRVSFFLQFGRNCSRLTLKKLWRDVKSISALLIFFRFVGSPEALKIENSHEGQKLKLPYISIWYFLWLQIACWFQKCKNFVVWRSISTTGGQIRPKYMKF